MFYLKVRFYREAEMERRPSIHWFTLQAAAGAGPTHSWAPDKELGAQRVQGPKDSDCPPLLSQAQEQARRPETEQPGLRPLLRDGKPASQRPLPSLHRAISPDPDSAVYPC